MDEKKKDLWDRADIIFKGLIPAVLAFATWQLNKRQADTTQSQFYANLMGRREEADSNLRKEMFNSILKTFVEAKNDPGGPGQSLLNLEILTYNFHESLDLAPVFKDLRERLAADKKDSAIYLGRLEKLSREVIAKQLDALKEPDRVNMAVGSANFGELPPEAGGNNKSEDAKAFLAAINNQEVTLVENGLARKRCVYLEVLEVDRKKREMEVRLVVSKIKEQQPCPRPETEDAFAAEREAQFTVGLFDFPMIDNLRLDNDDRVAVALTRLEDTDEFPQAELQVAYFPGTRASLKEKPYYDKIVERLAR